MKAFILLGRWWGCLDIGTPNSLTSRSSKDVYLEKLQNLWQSLSKASDEASESPMAWRDGRGEMGRWSENSVSFSRWWIRVVVALGVPTRLILYHQWWNSSGGWWAPEVSHVYFVSRFAVVTNKILNSRQNTFLLPCLNTLFLLLVLRSGAIDCLLASLFWPMLIVVLHTQAELNTPLISLQRKGSCTMEIHHLQNMNHPDMNATHFLTWILL